jgi:hypothetical protein
MDNQLQNDIMDSAETTAMLRISPWTLTAWAGRKKNTLPSIKFGWRTRRYSRRAILAWIERQSQKAA